MATMDNPQESVWDYPRPPRIEPDNRRVQVEFAGVSIADSTRSLRVLETSHPPVFYIPGEDIRMELLYPTQATSWCEFKGRAVYWTVEVEARRADNAVWGYPRPTQGYEALAGHFAFYPSKTDRCAVGGVPVSAQEGDFYGGWITPEITGPFKGSPGTRGW